MALSPSSPRLPSPPPPTEIQIGPNSPGLGGSMVEPAVEQSMLDSAFQLQEHLKALHYYYSKPSNGEDTIPISRESALLIASQPEGADRALWLYELCRFLINKCNDLIVGFLFDDPPCSATTCPEMRASEWQFLCAVHESPKSCCAIDYCCHTLDWATNIVTSQTMFPSRLSLGAGNAVDERGAGVKHLINIFRRLHRIFAHAWFQHRGVFWQVEGQTGLYVLFKTVCDNFDLLPAENYKLPPEAEGLEPVEEPRLVAPVIMKSGVSLGAGFTSDDDATRKNTRRHIRQSPSVGSAVTTVLEADEEEADVTQKFDDIRITADEGETEIPMIVEPFEPEERRVIPESRPEAASIQEVETRELPEAEDPSDTPVASTSSNSSWESMSSELEEKQHTDPEVSDPENPEEESVLESEGAQDEASPSLVVEEKHEPVVEKPDTEMVPEEEVERDSGKALDKKDDEELEGAQDEASPSLIVEEKHEPVVEKPAAEMVPEEEVEKDSEKAIDKKDDEKLEDS